MQRSNLRHIEHGRRITTSTSPEDPTFRVIGPATKSTIRYDSSVRKCIAIEEGHNYARGQIAHIYTNFKFYILPEEPQDVFFRYLYPPEKI